MKEWLGNSASLTWYNMNPLNTITKCMVMAKMLMLT